MAFITNYTFNKLCKNLDIKNEIDMQTFKDHIYNDANLFYFFNKLELKYLFNYKNLLENDEKYIAEYYQYVPKSIDTKSYVFEKPRKLKYHLTNECNFLNHDYVDFHIPKDITDLGDKVVEEFRAWFKSKGYAQKYFNGTLKNSKVVFDFNMKFPPKYDIKPLNENYKLVLELGNSSTYELDLAFDYDRFKENINIIKKKRTNRLQCKVTRTLAKFDYLVSKSDSEITLKVSEIFSNKFIENYGLKNLKELFSFSRNLKRELLENLTNYFKWSFNNKLLAIDNRSLEQFGLECCHKCQENSVLEKLH
jgi:hypothetical protein